MASLYDQLRTGFGLFGRANDASSVKSPSPAKKIARSGRHIPDLSLWAQFQRVGGALTPQQVSEIIRQADTGYMWRLMDLANEVRQKDCHLQGILETSEQSIAELDWDLELPEKPKAKERRAAERVEEILRNHPQLPSLFGHQVGARYYGYAVTENPWEKSGGQLVPGVFEFHAPRRFGFDQKTGQFIWRDWNSPSAGIDFLGEWPDNFIVSRPRVTGDVAVREGLVRPLMWAALFRNWTLADWLKLGEIAWRPWRTGQYAKGSEQEDIDELVAILESLTTSGIAAYPEGTNLKIEWPGGKGGAKPGHMQLFGVMASEMSKVVLGQTETTESSQSSGYAQAKVHREVQKDKRNAMARWVGADVQRDLVAKIYKLNYGTDIRPARFRFRVEESADLPTFADGIEKLTKAKLRVPAKWAREQVGIPEPEKGEEIIGIDIPIDPTTGLPKDPDAATEEAEPPPAAADPNAPSDEGGGAGSGGDATGDGNSGGGDA